MASYYNEIDPFAVAWLKALIKAKQIPDGEVDSRSIVDVAPSDLQCFVQCHFFAGIGGWSRALRLASWSPERPVWTGSCPCQPFSTAGKGCGFTDERHLWPAWFHLIVQCRPRVVFGEQVAKALQWLDLVHADMEGAGYAFAPVDLCAPSVGAFHIRQRLWFVADADAGRRQTRGISRPGEADKGREARRAVAGRVVPFELGDADNARPQGRAVPAERTGELSTRPTGVAGGLADSAILPSTEHEHDARERETGGTPHAADGRGPGFWSAADWIPCRDGKARPVEPGTFPLAHGIPARVGRLRGYGNAVVPEVAAAVIGAYMRI